MDHKKFDSKNFSTVIKAKENINLYVSVELYFNIE